jgi:hypothetical protein
LKYNQPFGVSDPNAAYINGNPSTGTSGSIPPAASIEYPQREIVNFITSSGLVPSNGDLNQLAESVQSGRVNYGIDNGTVNAMNITLSPTPLALLDGLIAIVKALTTNTGATVMTTNGGAAKAVMRRGGQALLANDIRANEDHLLIYNTFYNGWMLYPAGWNGGGGQLVTNLDLYVNTAIGNDANDGSANVAGKALKTIQKAFNIAYTYAPSGQFIVNVHVADGTYPESCLTPSWGGPTINLTGNTTTPANCLVSGGLNTVPGTICVQGPNVLNVTGFQVNSVTSPTNRLAGFFASAGATMNTSITRSGVCQGGIFEAFGGATMNINGNHTFTGSCDELFLAYSAGNVYTPNPGPQFTIANAITVNATAVTVNCGVILFQNHAATFVNPGNVTGLRYNSTLNGVIDTQVGGATYLPGTVAGQTVTGGQYQ